MAEAGRCRDLDGLVEPPFLRLPQLITANVRNGWKADIQEQPLASTQQTCNPLVTTKSRGGRADYDGEHRSSSRTSGLENAMPDHRLLAE